MSKRWTLRKPETSASKPAKVSLRATLTAQIRREIAITAIVGIVTGVLIGQFLYTKQFYYYRVNLNIKDAQIQQLVGMLGQLHYVVTVPTNSFYMDPK